MANQLCPLSDEPATYEISYRPYCKHFKCPTCTEFFIDASSEAHIAGLPEVTKTKWRADLSKRAQACPADRVFVIRAPRNDELGGDGHGVAKTTMIVECLSREPGGS
jgi:hypothetical protein